MDGSAGKSITQINDSDRNPCDGYLNGGPPLPTQEQCEAFGGHCYESTDYLLMSDPPQSVRICKHCRKNQIGHQQPDMVWRDA